MVPRHYRRPGCDRNGRPVPADALTCDVCARSVQPAADHPDRVQAGAHLVDPHPPDALDRGDRGERHVGVLAVQHRARAAVRAGQQGRRGTTCGWSRPGSARRAARARAAAASSSQLWSAVLAKPEPRVDDEPVLGDTGRRRPPRAAGRARRGPRPSTSSYDACCCISVEWARQCITTYAAPCSATTSRIRGSASPPETSLTSTAPASSAAAATSGRIVSTETATPSAASARITGTTRSSSSATSGRVAPGRVDSPPMSSRSAPSSRSAAPCAIAASVVP